MTAILPVERVKEGGLKSVFAIVLVAFANTVGAEDTTTYLELSSRIKAPGAVAKIGPDLFGDQVNLRCIRFWIRLHSGCEQLRYWKPKKVPALLVLALRLTCLRLSVRYFNPARFPPSYEGRMLKSRYLSMQPRTT